MILSIDYEALFASEQEYVVSKYEVVTSSLPR
jgi:hypothetical protein